MTLELYILFCNIPRVFQGKLYELEDQTFLKKLI